MYYFCLSLTFIFSFVFISLCITLLLFAYIVFDFPFFVIFTRSFALSTDEPLFRCKITLPRFPNECLDSALMMIIFSVFSFA